MSKVINITVGFLALYLVACSSSPTTQKKQAVPDILEPAEEPALQTPSLPSAHLERVLQLLAGLGYQGVGLELEDDSTLDFVEAVFSSPKAQNRKIQLVYTGLKLSYDKEQQSLTLGEREDLAKTLRFIEKNVPTK